MTVPNGKEVHHFRNNFKAVSIGNLGWEQAAEAGLINLVVDTDLNTGELVSDTGHRFYNMCSCSYLGLHQHPSIIQAAHEAVRTQAYLSVAPVRIRLRLLHELDNELSRMFDADAIFTTSATYSSLGVLPLIASGHIGDGSPRHMAFDKHCHFSMALTKPICADETQVSTVGHNDLSALETCCKKYGRVAYVADGVYSMGGVAVLNDLYSLQQRYDLLLYFDDAHSISIFGKNGQGFVRSSRPELNEKTIIVGSLAKAFGAAGGFIATKDRQFRDVMERFGGPTGWSQEHMPAVMGAALASAKLHQTAELLTLQGNLRMKIQAFDQILDTEDSNSPFPVRVITVGESKSAIALASRVFERGFYVSPVFFPIVAQGRAGIRVMVRADVPMDRIVELANIIREERGNL